MKVTKHITGTLAVEFEAADQQDAFEQLARHEEVFSQNTCIKCGTMGARPMVRYYDENKYYEMRCVNRDCRAVLSYGCHKKGGGLFPKRKDADGNWLPDDGWVRYNKETGKSE